MKSIKWNLGLLFRNDNDLEIDRELRVAEAWDEHAAQCMCIEMLRGLLARYGTDIAAYNNSTPEEFDALAAAAYARSSLNVNAPGYQLIETDRGACAGLGGTFFEQGYVAYMADRPQTDKITYTRIGGF